MKKITAIIASLIMILGVCAGAEGFITPMNDMLFMNAKEALTMFDAGDYQGACTSLGFGTPEEFEKFITGNYLTFGTEPVQTTVAVAWWSGSAWCMAIPLHEPASPEVEALVLLTDSIDCSTFCGYTFALWGDVEAELAMSDYIVWNEEYIGTESMIIYMDD